MELPNAARAIIDPVKLHGYLLSRTHPVGRFKAAFFASLGYTARKWQDLEADLRSQHLTQEPADVIETEFGLKYVIRANLTGPSDRSAAVVSVWFVAGAEDQPRFVTAYPSNQS